MNYQKRVLKPYTLYFKLNKSVKFVILRKNRKKNREISIKNENIIKNYP